MKNISKIVICSVVALLSFGQVAAQNQELSVTGGLGLSSLKFDVRNGEHSNKFGGHLGVGYSYFFNDNFGLNTGLEVTLYSSKAKLNSFTDSYKAQDFEGDFMFNTSVSDYKEKQSSAYLNIPVMGQYQLPVMEDSYFYVAAGGKIGIPINGSYKTSGAKYETSGTFEQLGGITITDRPGQGFYEFSGRKVDEDLDFKVAFMLSLETGMKWALSESMYLYTGVYFDYGLNDIRKGDKNQRFLVYEAPQNGKKAENFDMNSILHSQYTENNVTKSMTDKVVPMAIGLKLRLAFSLPQ